jgi:selenium-binding protein 1
MKLQVSVARIGWVFALGFAACGGHANDTNSATTDNSVASSDAEARARRDNVMYVWASDVAHVAPDFVAVVDFDQDSPTYGSVLRTVGIPAPNATGNEPHHIGLSADGNTLGLGGLLSVLRGQDEIFFFDVSHSRHPKFLSSSNPPLSAITDEFVTKSSGGFFVTMMGSAAGGEPGRVAEYDAGNNLLHEWPDVPPTDGSFNPHGISVREEENLMVTSDFICPAHTLNIPGGDMVLLRDTVRIWDLAGRTILRTVHAGVGMMEIRLIPNDPQLRAYAPGFGDGKLYLIDTQNGTQTVAYDLNNFAVPGTPGVFPGLTQMTSDGSRLFVVLGYFGTAGKIVMFDTSDPENPEPLDVVDLGTNAGPHYLRLTRDERRLITSDYFLVEDLAPGGVVQADGDHKVHVMKVHRNHLELDSSFDLDLNRDIATGPARPHGIAVKRAHDFD